MKRFVAITYLSVLISSSSLAEEIPPIYLSHTNTIWENRGYCAYAIGLDAGGGSGSPEMHDLKITVKVLSEGDTIGEFSPRTETLIIPKIGGANAYRYNSVAFESACELESIEVVSATAILADTGKKIDLIANNLLAVNQHNPLPFKFGK